MSLHHPGKTRPRVLKFVRGQKGQSQPVQRPVFEIALGIRGQQPKQMLARGHVKASRIIVLSDLKQRIVRQLVLRVLRHKHPEKLLRLRTVGLRPSEIKQRPGVIRVRS